MSRKKSTKGLLLLVLGGVLLLSLFLLGSGLTQQSFAGDGAGKIVKVTPVSTVQKRSFLQLIAIGKPGQCALEYDLLRQKNAKCVATLTFDAGYLHSIYYGQKDFYGRTNVAFNWNGVDSCAGWMTKLGCNPNSCVSETGDKCTGDASDAKKVECTRNVDCKSYGQSCLSGKCKNSACQPGSFTCEKGNVYLCQNSNGGKLAFYTKCSAYPGKMNWCAKDLLNPSTSPGSHPDDICSDAPEEDLSETEKLVVKKVKEARERNEEDPKADVFSLLCNSKKPCNDPLSTCTDGICIPYDPEEDEASQSAELPTDSGECTEDFTYECGPETEMAGKSIASALCKNGKYELTESTCDPGTDGESNDGDDGSGSNEGDSLCEYYQKLGEDGECHFNLVALHESGKPGVIVLETLIVLGLLGLIIWVSVRKPEGGSTSLGLPKLFEKD